MDNDPVFSKKEIGEILSKASEIQNRKDISGDQDGLSKKEILEIAHEVGIDENSVFEALQNIQNPESNTPFSWIRGTSKTQAITTINKEISDDDWEDIILEVRRITGGIGRINKVGKSFEWEQSVKDIGYKHLSLSPKDGKTKIQFVNSWSGIKFIVSFFSFLIPFMITAISQDGSTNTILFSSILATLGGLAGLSASRIFLKLYFERQKERANSLLSAISDKFTEPNSSNSVKINIEENVFNSENESSGDTSSKVKS